MQGFQVMERETAKFKSDLIKITKKFVTECSNVAVDMTVPNCKYIPSSTNTCFIVSPIEVVGFLTRFK